MKTKKIIIKSREDADSEVLAMARRLDRKENTKPQKAVYFESLDAVRAFLTERRLELWRAIRDQKPASLLELSRMLKRDYKDVHHDISVLLDVGLIELRKTKGAKTRALKPISLADQLEFKVA